MGLLDFFSKKKNEEALISAETCALCGQPGADKEFAGQLWHKKCMRSARKAAKGMI
ncbi:MAG: hypothetical protein HY917_04525 [Candidatus Diapherotrites archaeon]|nr:hypothetical protein [Candidatus Diapherotrites archaeon]